LVKLLVKEFKLTKREIYRGNIIVA
jgi:hypothetical protein